MDCIMAKKTTKTAHVMSLLTKPESVIEVPDKEDATKAISNEQIQKEQEQDNQVAAAVHENLKSLIEEDESYSSTDDPIQTNEIELEDFSDEANDVGSEETSSLEKSIVAALELENVTEYQNESFDDPNDHAPKPTPTPATASTSVNAPAPVTMHAPAPSQVQPTPVATQIPPQPVVHQPYENEIDVAAEDELFCINVMEQIVKNELTRVMEQFNLCMCNRCKSDVLALTLNALTPKYAVATKGQLFAKLSSYENQYSTDLIQAMTRACISVKARPRH